MNSLIANNNSRLTRLNRVHSPRRHSAVATVAVSICDYLCPSVAKLAVSAVAFIIYSLSFITFLASASATTYYVKETGNNSSAGTSWATALASVGTAITKATSGDEIWIAAGTYKQGFFHHDEKRRRY